MTIKGSPSLIRRLINLGFSPSDAAIISTGVLPGGGGGGGGLDEAAVQTIVDDAIASAPGGAPPVADFYVPGTWYDSSVIVLASNEYTPSNIGANYARLVKFTPKNDFTADQMGVFGMNVGGESKYRFGIYGSDSATGKPGDLLAGPDEVTIAANVSSAAAAIDIDFVKGMTYYLAVLPNVAATMKCYYQTKIPALGAYELTSESAYTAMIFNHQPFGALPESLEGVNLSIDSYAVPIIRVRAA